MAEVEDVEDLAKGAEVEMTGEYIIRKGLMNDHFVLFFFVYPLLQLSCLNSGCQFISRRRRDASPPGGDSTAGSRQENRQVDEWGREVFDIDMTSTADFPSLGGTSSNLLRPAAPQFCRRQNATKTAEDFPTLGPPPGASDAPLSAPIRRPTPNFKNAMSKTTNSSLSSVLGASSSGGGRQPPAPRPPQTVPFATQKVGDDFYIL